MKIYFLSIYANKISHYFKTQSISHKFFPKSKKENQFWTFLDFSEMSKNGNPKKVLKNTLFFTF